MNIEKVKNTLRLVALATTDNEARICALDALNESEEQARDKLSQTCFKDDINDLRQAMIKNNGFAKH